ncbi:hypothetical protein [Desulfofustis glycolicus]|uniref:Uncharacterized protein n=1 Tax=Desulfofustis glycolicus DSM 9705 TaxID=1121409 RepID=A0A1M5XC70_9BACT|nr:hypothetical protein [Desulfofustis glycolicus]SHH97339.1 hypothetical protein SAMN02745124_02938 [Desulfofustis glycolicus DSM 9705]
MQADFIEILIERAHQILGDSSVYEVIDLDNAAARDRIREIYGNVEAATINAYLKVVDEIRVVTIPSQEDIVLKAD